MEAFILQNILYFIVGSMIAGVGFGALGRHGQGGAMRRIVAYAIYLPILVPAAVILAPVWWVGSLKAALLIVGWYFWISMKEYFGSLWHSVWRYCGPILFCCVVMQFWYGLVLMPIVWYAAKWAKESHDGIADPHQIFEYVEGGAYGGLWMSVVFWMMIL
jgi:hypothetical protein